MWRSILAVVLLPSIVWAQEPSLSVPEKQEPVATNPQPDYKALIDPRTIRPGKTKKAVVVLFLTQSLVVSRNESSSDMVPLKIDFEKSDGLTVTSLSFPDEQRRNFAFHDEAMRKGELLEPPEAIAYGRSATSRFPGIEAPSRTDGALPLGERNLLRIRDTRVRVLDGRFLRVNLKLKASKTAPGRTSAASQSDRAIDHRQWSSSAPADRSAAVCYGRRSRH